MSKQANRYEKPVHRSSIRARIGMGYYGLWRWFFWFQMRSVFAKTKGASLPHIHFRHQTPLYRPLKNVELQYQSNKIVNLHLAANHLDGIVVKPGESFSYWKLIGKPTKSKGYLDGMILHNGHVGYGPGGGLCQLSNLIYWMTLHTPLTVLERHRHGYDVFPDADRTQPFGSGATCFYPHIDLMIQNNTPWNFQLSVRVGEDFLEGAWLSDSLPLCQYELVERNHHITAEYWGGYTRRNAIHRRTLTLDGELLREELVASNDAIMMYAPFIEQQSFPYTP